MKVIAFTIQNIPLIQEGDDIGRIISERAEIEEYDIIVVSSTIVSKSEGRVISLNNVKVTERAEIIAKKIGNDARFVQAVLDQSKEILLESPFLLVRNHIGNICVNAGIDRSNIEGEDNILLLPEDADKSAREIKEAIFKHTGKKVSVIITDTSGRAFRIGQTGVAIGVAGITTTIDWRGTKDLFGKMLEVKNEAVVDEISGFANLLMGEGDGATPVVIIRGLRLYQERCSITQIYRTEEEDVISKALKSHSA